MKKCKIKSIKSLGTQKTYNLTMKSDQHNYFIFDPETGHSVCTKNSHSAAYAFIAYQCCWLKTYYPLEFMCNLFTSEINNSDQDRKLNSYIKFATDRLKLIIQKCDINKSNTVFKIVKNENDKDVILTPLTALKGVGLKAVQSIVSQQPFKSLEDLLRRIDRRVVNVRVFNSLVEWGCFDFTEWGRDREKLLADYEEVKKNVDKEKKAEAKMKKEKEKQEKIMGQGLFGGSFDFSGDDVKI